MYYKFSWKYAKVGKLGTYSPAEQNNFNAYK